jgi:hypothetical protein
MKYFDLEFETDMPVLDLIQETVATWTGRLASNGYTLTSRSEFGATYHRKYRPTGSIVLAVLFFPLGLLFLLATNNATITITVEKDDDSGNSILTINGSAPKAVRKGFEQLELEGTYFSRRSS